MKMMEQHLFSRSALLLGAEGMERLKNSHVAVFGVGGVGSYLVEALARGGVGSLTLVDKDVVSLTNINRQLIACHSTLGMAKVEAARRRILDINPACTVQAVEAFFLPETADLFSFQEYDYVADAVDTVSAKLELAVRCEKAGVPLISCMGTGNKLNPLLFEVADIYETSVCPLCRVMRHELRKRGIGSLKVVYSKEEPLKPLPTSEKSEKRQTPGSLSFVPPVAGLILAGEIIRHLAGERATDNFLI